MLQDKCPKCANSVLPEAANCLHCGRALRPEARNQFSAKQKGQENKTPIGWIILAIGGIIAVLVMLGSPSSDREKAEKGSPSSNREKPEIRSVLNCEVQQFEDWSNHCAWIVAYADVVFPPEEVPTKVTIAYDGTLVRLFGVVPEWYHLKFYTNNLPPLVRIEAQPYVTNRTFFNKKFPSTITVGDETVYVSWVDDELHWVASEPDSKRLARAFRSGSDAVIEYSHAFEGKGQSITVSLSGFAAAFENFQSGGRRQTGAGQEDGDRAAADRRNQEWVEKAEREATERKATDYGERLHRELDIISSFKIDIYLTDRVGILLGVSIFSDLATIAEDGESIELNADQAALLRRLKREVSKFQQTVLPRLRDAFGPILRKQLWEHDISAKTFGKGYRTIQFVGGAFAANSNIKAFNDEMWETFNILRFKQVRYKWYAEASEYTRFNVGSPDDDKLIVWEKDGRFREVR